MEAELPGVPRLADDPSTVDFLEHLSRYQQLRYLSRGLFGHVVQALDNETGETVAVKLIERGTDTLTRHVTREIVNHSSLSHPHIVQVASRNLLLPAQRALQLACSHTQKTERVARAQFRDCFLTSRYVAIVMEYCEGGNLWHYTAQRCAACRTCMPSSLPTVRALPLWQPSSADSADKPCLLDSSPPAQLPCRLQARAARGPGALVLPAAHPCAGLLPQGAGPPHRSPHPVR